MEAAIRAYFSAGKDPAALWTEFRAAVARSKVKRYKDSMEANATSVLTQFLSWDEDEADTPAEWLPALIKTPPISWRGHHLVVRPDLIYLVPAGQLVRLLWTDNTLSPANPRAATLAAASLVYTDRMYREGGTVAVDAWQLRRGERQTWNRDTLEMELDFLKQRLDDVESALESS